MKFINYIWARLNETSTWLAICIGATAVYHSLQNHASLEVALIAGVTAALLPEGKTV